MEIKIVQEDLSQVDCGGGYREAEARIVIDNTIPPIMQKSALICEILSLYLDPMEYSNDLMTDLAYVIAEALEQLEEK